MLVIFAPRRDRACTLLRICEVFELPMSKVVQGLDAEGVYEKLEPVLPLRRRRRT